MRQGDHDALLHQRKDFRQLGPGPIRRHPTSHVDREVGQAVSEWPEVDRAAAIDVALPEFEEPAADAQEVEAPDEGFAGQRVEDNVHALSTGQGHDLVREIQGARVGHVLHAEVAQKLPFRRCACRCEHLQAGMESQLHGRLADAAGGRVDQNPFAGLHPREFMQGVVDGEVGHRNRCGILHGDARRQRQGHGGRDRQMRGHRAEPHPEDAVAHSPIPHRFADPYDDAGKLISQKVGIFGLSRIDTQHLHDITEIQPDSADLDLDLRGGRRTTLQRPQPQTIDDA